MRGGSSPPTCTIVPFGASLIYFDTNSNKVIILARGLCVVGSSPTVPSQYDGHSSTGRATECIKCVELKKIK